MDYKLLVLDLDGTLTNSKKQISFFTKEILLEAQEKGLRIVLASGRPTYGITPLAKMLCLEEFGGFILSFNGGKIIDCKRKRVLYEQVLDSSLLPIIYQRAIEAGQGILSYNGDYILSETPSNKYVQYESFLTKMQVQPTDNFLRDLQLPADKCLIVGEPEYLVPLEDKLRQEIGSSVGVYRWEPFYLEVVPKNVDKAASLDWLVQRLRLSSDNVIAMGDGYNDISMIKYAGLGVAMANAQAPIKANAKRITKHTNDENGVAWFIKDLLHL